MRQVVAESYEELVFSEPTEAFHSRVNAAQPAPVPATALSQHFPPDSSSFGAQELQTITAARQKNAQIMANLQNQLDRYS